MVRYVRSTMSHKLEKCLLTTPSKPVPPAKKTLIKPNCRHYFNSKSFFYFNLKVSPCTTSVTTFPAVLVASLNTSPTNGRKKLDWTGSARANTATVQTDTIDFISNFRAVDRVKKCTTVETEQSGMNVRAFYTFNSHTSEQCAVNLAIISLSVSRIRAVYRTKDTRNILSYCFSREI